MATTTYGSPYVAGTDLVSGWPTASQNVANRIDDVSIKGNGVNAQSGAGYTLVLTDAGKLVTLSNGSAQNLTIPLNSSVAYATGTTIDVLNIGTGTWTLTGSPTINGTTSLPTGRQVRLVKTGTDTWYAQPYGTGGLTYITTQTFSAAASVSVNNCFTSTYDAYRIIIRATGSTDLDCSMRMRVSAADNTAATYNRQLLDATSTTVTASASTGQTTFNAIFRAPASGAMTTIDLYGPALAATTFGQVFDSQTLSTARLMFAAINHTTASAFDGFTFYPGSGTITGTVRVYGYQNA